MGVVGLLALGMAGPAVVAASASTTAAAEATAEPAPADDEIQAFVTSAESETVELERAESNFDVASMSDLASEAGVTQFANTWVNNPEAEVQWPFEVGVPISAPFGSATYLATFSSPHRGVDLTPGAGAEIRAIAGGTVRLATESGGDFGVTVIIDHEVNGQKVASRYAHMQYGSLQVTQGQVIEAGTVVGKVGSTGKSTGAHLHLELLLPDDTRIDPIAWIQQNTEG